MNRLESWRTPLIETLILAVMAAAVAREPGSFDIAVTVFVSCLWVISVVIAAIEETKQ